MKDYMRTNDRVAWSDGELATLRQLVGLELPMRVIARKLKRPEEAVRATALRTAMADIRRCPATFGRWQAGH